MSETMTRAEINCETGEVTIIPLTQEEILEIQQKSEQFIILEAEREAAEAAKAAAKASAEAKLAALGLTPEEIAALR